MPNEADTCRKFVVPRLQAAGWETEPHRLNEQVTFTDGRIIAAGSKGHRRPGKRADYLLRYRPDLSIAVVEAKASYCLASDGLQQAKDYAQILGLKFAYATNGHEIVEFDFLQGCERTIGDFPTPDELWQRLLAGSGLSPQSADRLLTPAYHLSGKSPRYYQEIAINRTIQAILQGQKRVLLTMATGTGKTVVAFQICWKLWSSRWNRDPRKEYRRPRILYLADRNILIDDPKDKTFTPFGDARWKIENERVDGLVVVAGDDEVFRVLTPLPDELQLHPVQVLRLVREDDGRIARRRVHIALAHIDQIREVQEAVLLLILRPFLFEFYERGRPAFAREHQPAIAAQALEFFVAGFLRFGIVFRPLLAVQPAVLLGQRDGEGRMVPVPFADVRLGDLRPAEHVPAV